MIISHLVVDTKIWDDCIEESTWYSKALHAEGLKVCE